MSFAEDVRAFLPPGLTLPDEFVAVFDWAEARGQLGRFTHSKADDITAHYLSIYPLEQMNELGASYVLFGVDTPPLAAPIPDEISSRCVSIADAAGDGGKLALWLDPADILQFVIFDHGWPYTLTDDPLVALQFLAIGYSEPASLFDPTQTAAEQRKTDYAEPAIMPLDYIAFLEATFGLTVPDRASDLGIVIPLDDDLSDPVRIWLEAHTPEEPPEDIPGMTAQNPLVISKEFADMLDADTLATLQNSVPFVVIEE